MASSDRHPTDPVIERLAREPFAFDFFRAVRLLENRRLDQPRVGCSESLSEDPVRFAQNPSLAFAPATLESFRPADGTAMARLVVRFFGLTGPNAPLPPHITEYALERQLHHGDRTIAEFFNIFHHRLISFFYRAWAVNQLPLDFDRPDDPRFANFVGSFFGIGMPALQRRDAVPDQAKLFFSGRLANQPRNAEGLEAIVQEFFEIPTRVHSFVGRWLDLPSDSVCRLGESTDTGTLGVATIVGSRFWDCQLSFRIQLGPMNLSAYERMLPTGHSFPRLKAWVLNYCGQQYFWDVQLILKADEVPATRLGHYGQLGWTTWLKTQPFKHDAEDLILITES